MTDGRGVDLVVATGGARTLLDASRCLAPDGVIAVVGFVGGAQASVDLMALLRARGSLRPVTVGPRRAMEAMLTAISRHRVRPVLDSVFPWERYADAFRRLESGHPSGKVVVEVAC